MQKPNDYTGIEMNLENCKADTYKGAISMATARIRLPITLPIVGKVWMTGRTYQEAVTNLMAKYAWLYPDSAPPVSAKFTTPQTPTVREMGERWIAEDVDQRVGEARLRNLSRTLLNHIYPIIGETHVGDIKFSEANQFYMRFNGYGVGVVRNIKTCMRGIFDFCIDCGIVDENPFRNGHLKVRNVRPCETREPIPDRDLIAALNKLNNLNFQQLTAFLFGLYAGLRSGEVFALRWEDVHLETPGKEYVSISKTTAYDRDLHTIIKSPKTKAGVRNVPLNATIVEHLKKVDPLNRSGYILHKRGDTESYIAKNSATRTCKIALCNIGLGQYTFHQLRHTFATKMQPHTDVKTLQYLMGHSSASITLNTYAALDVTQLEKTRDVQFVFAS